MKKTLFLLSACRLATAGLYARLGICDNDNSTADSPSYAGSEETANTTEAKSLSLPISIMSNLNLS